MSLDDLHISLSHDDTTWTHDYWLEVTQRMKLKRKVSPSSMTGLAVVQPEHLCFDGNQTIIHLIQSFNQNSLWNGKNRSDFKSNRNLEVLSKLLTKNESLFIRIKFDISFVLFSFKFDQIWKLTFGLNHYKILLKFYISGKN